MVKGINCNNCFYLDKTNKYTMGSMYQYGCKCLKANKGYIVGWLSKDSGLNNMGCCYCNKLLYGTVFKSTNDNYIYLGRHNKKYRLFNITTKSKKAVGKQYFKNIKLEIYNPENICVIYKLHGEYLALDKEQLLTLNKAEKETIFETIKTVIHRENTI